MSEVVLQGADKHALVLAYAKPYGVLVETGLWNGGGASTSLVGALACYAIDAQRANVVSAREVGVHAYEGDSAVMLPQLLQRLPGPVCFWLDAHMVAAFGDPAVNESHCPLLAELDAIIAWEHGATSTVLIDDMRMMGADGWPEIAELDRVTMGVWRWDDRDDVLRLTPLKIHP